MAITLLNDFMQGGCYAFALWMHRKTHFPLYGLWDDAGSMHHAFIYDVDGEVAYDARGPHAGLDAIAFHRGARCAGTSARPATVAEVREHAEWIRWLGGPVPSPRSMAAFAKSSPLLARLIANRAV